MSLFAKLKENSSYRTTVIDALLSGISENHVDTLSSFLNYVIDEKYQLFDDEELKGFFYEDDEDEISDLILPAIRRLYGKTFISPPSLFTGIGEQERYKLFILYFNIDEFIEYLVDMLKKSKGMLNHFDYIDKTVETLTLIVDNYIAGNVKKVRDCEDIDTEIKKSEREFKIKDILNG